MTSSPLARKISTGYCKSRAVAGDVSIGEFLNWIRNGQFQATVERYRSALQNEEMGKPLGQPETEPEAIKHQLRAAMFSGSFSERSAAHLIDHSGVICIDIDDVQEHLLADTKSKIQSLPQCLACFVSPSGRGVKALLLGNKSRPHIEMYRAAEKLVKDSCGIQIDPSCKDVNRLCFGSFDPAVYVNADATEMSYAGIEPSDSLESDGKYVRAKSPEKFTENLPGNDYDLRGDFPGLLLKHGWTRNDDNDDRYWVRPGKSSDSGISASFNVLEGLPNAFYVFSSNAAPLEQAKPYRPWQVYAIYECEGDFSRAAASLYQQGFGAKPDRKIAELEGITDLLPKGWELTVTEFVGKSTPEFAWLTLQKHSVEVKAAFEKNKDAAMRAFANVFSYALADELYADRLRVWWKSLGGGDAKLLDKMGNQARKKREAHERTIERADTAKRVGETIEETQKVNPIFYVEETGSYFRKVGERYGKMNRQDALLELACKGLTRETPEGCLYSPAEEALNSFQKDNAIDAAGPLCGRPAGLHILPQGLRFLVTTSPRIIEGKQGECPTIMNIIETLLGAKVDTHGPGQVQRFLWWLNHGRRALRDFGTHTPGHALFLVGPKNAGKTLLQSFIVRPCLGGREADPMNYMTDKTTFNSDLWKAELLSISDGVLGHSPSRETREMFRGKVKALVANETQPFHPKGKDQLHMNPIWRIILSFNTDYASMQNIPPVSDASDDSFSDKCLMFLCHKGEKMFFDPRDPEERIRFIETIKSEIPAFIWKVEHTEVPAECADTRLGFFAWQHPTILEGLAKSGGGESFQSLFRFWVENDSADTPSKKEGNRGVIAKGEIFQIYGKFKNFLSGGTTPTLDPRMFERACPYHGFESKLMEMKAQAEWSPLITNRHSFRTEKGDVKKGWAVFGVSGQN
jgi:hypothetical protein